MLFLVLAASAAEYRVVDLGTLGGANAAASAINERGQIVGISSTAGPEQHAFVWSDGQMVDLGTLGGLHSFAWDINGLGQVVGGAQDADGHTHAVLWDGGKAVDLGVLPGGEASFALAVNDRGQVAGFSQAADGETHAVLWADGAMTDLGTLGGAFSYAVDVNTRGDVLAMSSTPGGHAAFLWREGGRVPVGPATAAGATAFDVNDRGQVVGTAVLEDGMTLVGYRWSPDGAVETFGLGGDIVVVSAVNEAGDAVGYGTIRPGGARGVEARGAGLPDLERALVADAEVPVVEVRAFVYRGGKVVDLGTLGGPHASAIDINKKGQVIGTSDDVLGIARAYVWQDGAMTALPTPSGATAGASDLNDQGQVVGSWSSTDGRRRAFVAVPCGEGEPCLGPRRGTD